MRKKFMVGLVALLSIIGLGLVAPSVASAQSPMRPSITSAEDYTDSPYFGGGRFRTKEICIHQTFGGTAWLPGDIGNFMEPAVNTGWRSASQGCSGYPAWQVMKVNLYSDDDGRCTKWTGNSNPASYYIGHPMNEWYNRVWDGSAYAQVWINQYYNNTCWATDFDRNYRLSREMLNVVGLQAYCSYTPSQSGPMNECSESTLAMEWPGALERNRITVLMNP